jgi:hypothetical protein
VDPEAGGLTVHVVILITGLVAAGFILGLVGGWYLILGYVMRDQVKDKTRRQ